MASNLTRGSQEKIDETSIENGKIRFAIDSARLFIDTQNERVEITDIVYGLKEAEITALVSPLPKVYLTSDTYKIMSYNFTALEWITYGGSSQQVEKAEKDILGQKIDSTYTKDLSFNNDNNIVLTFGNDNTKTVTNPLVATITTLSNTVNTLSNDLTNLTNTVSTLSTTVGNLQGDVSTLSGTVNTLSTNLSDLTNTVNTLSTTVTNLSTDLSTLTTNVTNLTTRVETLETTKYNVVLIDS